MKLVSEVQGNVPMPSCHICCLTSRGLLRAFMPWTAHLQASPVVSQSWRLLCCLCSSSLLHCTLASKAPAWIIARCPLAGRKQLEKPGSDLQTVRSSRLHPSPHGPNLQVRDSNHQSGKSQSNAVLYLAPLALIISSDVCQQTCHAARLYLRAILEGDHRKRLTVW